MVNFGWRSVMLLCVLIGCGFKTIQDSAETTLYAGDLVLNIHSSDVTLNNRLQREFKVIAKPVLKKPYRMDVQLNPQQSPVLYDHYGSAKRWHSLINADLMIVDKSNRVIAHKQIEARQSFDHTGERDRLLAAEGMEDFLTKDLAQQIVHIITCLP
jgi:hypothetical protein